MPDGMRAARLLVKRDDLTSALYGGNKVRKLEHVLADAELAGARSIVTIGGIGSNQGLATALHGRALGFDVELSLLAQPLTPVVRANLLGDLAAGARVRFAMRAAQGAWNAWRAHDQLASAGRRPYFIMTGATTRVGNVGYVTAAFELAEQVRSGSLPCPDRIFVAAGTCGTAAGLIAGLKLAGLPTRVTAVRVYEPFVTNAAVIREYAMDVVGLLRALDPSVPDVRIDESDFDVETRFFGAGYGAPTDEGRAAIDWAAPALTLETTYTAKTVAACLAYCRDEARAGETVLYWHTYNSAPFPKAESLEGLPRELVEYVERG
jgi:D-cysteine desulfhydrase